MFPPPTPKQAKTIWLAVTGLAIATLVALVVGLIWGLGMALNILSPVLWPLALAGVIAYLLDPVVDFLEGRGVPRTRAILCVFALAFMLMIALLSSVVPQLVIETRQLATRIPDYSKSLKRHVESWITHPPAPLRRLLGNHVFQEANTNAALTNASFSTNLSGDVTSSSSNSNTNSPAITSMTNAPPDTNAAGLVTSPDGAHAFWSDAFGSGPLKSATGWLAQMLPRVGAWIFGQVTRVASWFGVLAGLALIPIYAFYFLLEKKGIESKWTDYLPVTRSEFKDELVFILRSVNGYLIVFFRSQLLVAICDGVLYAVGFLIIGLPYAVLLGVMAIFLTMIPFLGAMATCAAALIIAFVQYGDWQHPVGVLAVFGVVQTLEGLFIQPKIMGDRVGLHPLTIIVAVMVGTTMLGGILGGILAIPLTAAARVLMFRYVWTDPTTVVRKK